MKFRLVLAILLSILFLPFCTSTKKGQANAHDSAKPGAISYQKDILPIMQARCTPCHFPEQGKKKMLDTYGAVKNNLDDILTRIQLPPGDEKFMPFKSKKEPLSDSLVMVFKQWKNLGMPE